MPCLSLFAVADELSALLASSELFSDFKFSYQIRPDDCFFSINVFIPSDYDKEVIFHD